MWSRTGRWGGQKILFAFFVSEDPGIYAAVQLEEGGNRGYSACTLGSPQSIIQTPGAVSHWMPSTLVAVKTV